MTKNAGVLNRLIGWATGDRHAEAQGKAKQETGHKPTREEVEQAETEVRAAHHDFGTPPPR